MVVWLFLFFALFVVFFFFFTLFAAVTFACCSCAYNDCRALLFADLRLDNDFWPGIDEGSLPLPLDGVWFVFATAAVSAQDGFACSPLAAAFI